MATLGQRLKELRLEKRLTQADIGKMLNVSNVSVSGYESGTREPDSSSIAKLADFYEVSTDYLMGVTNNRQPQSKTIDLSDDDVIMSFEGRPIPPEDMELIKRLLRGAKHD